LPGVAAIGAVLLLQTFDSFACHRHDVVEFPAPASVFVGIPLLPAPFSLANANPLRAAGWPGRRLSMEAMDIPATCRTCSFSMNSREQ
jgi:hypothetical protein